MRRGLWTLQGRIWVSNTGLWPLEIGFWRWVGGFERCSWIFLDFVPSNDASIPWTEALLPRNGVLEAQRKALSPLDQGWILNRRLWKLGFGPGDVPFYFVKTLNSTSEALDLPNQTWSLQNNALGPSDESWDLRSRTWNSVMSVCAQTRRVWTLGSQLDTMI